MELGSGGGPGLGEGLFPTAGGLFGRQPVVSTTGTGLFGRQAGLGGGTALGLGGQLGLGQPAYTTGLGQPAYTTGLGQPTRPGSMPTIVDQDSIRPAKSKTRFYLVCGGEQLPEKERQDREQMNMICKIILDRGLAKKEDIYFISGRGTKINSSVNAHYTIATNTPFTMYGPNSTHPSSGDNAVVIFIGQGNYHAVPIQSSNQKSRSTPVLSSAYGFGDLMFINDSGVHWNYQPSLEHLVAKNTLFISLADYTERAFERAFEREKANSVKKLLAICLSGYFHAPNEKYLGKVLADFFDANDNWKENTIASFCETLKEKYENHPLVQETKKQLFELTKEDFDEEIKLRQSWARGNFQTLSISSGSVSDHNWEMFQAVGVIKDTVEKASEADMSPQIRNKLKDAVSKMVASRVDVMETKLLRPRAYRVVGDKDFQTMTWKEFLKID